MVSDLLAQVSHQLKRLNENIEELSSSGTGRTKVKTKTIVGDFTTPGSAVVVANEFWEDEVIEPQTFGGDLGPGESEEVARIESSNKDVLVAPRALGVTRHAHDLDGDGQNESAVTYRYEYKTDPSDSWGQMDGFTSSVPHGEIGAPEEILPGSYIGPISAFRIVFHNRSDDYSNSVTIGADEMGAQMHAKLVRGD